MGRGLSPPPLAAVRLPLPPLPGPSLAARLARRGLPGAPAPGTPGLPVAVRARPNRCGGPALRRGFFNPRGGPSSFAPAAPAWPCGPPLSLRSRGSAPPAGLCPGVGGPAPGGFGPRSFRRGGAGGARPVALRPWGVSPARPLSRPPPAAPAWPGVVRCGVGGLAVLGLAALPCRRPSEPGIRRAHLGQRWGVEVLRPSPSGPASKGGGAALAGFPGACRDPRPPATSRPPSPSGGTRGSAGLAGVPTFFRGSD